MDKFSELKYVRPDYEKEKAVLLKYKDELAAVSTYQEFRNLWLSMNESLQYMEMLEEIGFIRHMMDTSNEFYQEEMRICNIEDPQIAVYKDACDKVVLSSPYISDFKSEFGEKIITQLKNNSFLSDKQSISLQIAENQLKTEYIKLCSLGEANETISNEIDRVYDELIHIRTNLARVLGFQNFIDMAFRKLGRNDYGTKEISAFRSQIHSVITPACNELKKYNIYDYPVPTGGVKDVVSATKSMFHDISQESGDFFDVIYDHELYDLEVRPNKRSNYDACCMIPHFKVPFILCNFKGKGGNINTFIHELGHGFAFYTAARSQKLYEYHRSSGSINEVHSKTMEFFAYPYLDRFFGEQKNRYIQKHLAESIFNLPYRCAVDEFEQAVYEDISLTKAQRRELWCETIMKYLPWRGNSKQERIKRGISWHYQSHLFNTPFSYIDYNFAQTSAFEYYGRLKDSYQETWKDYVMLCSKGGSTNYLNLLAVGKLTNPFSAGAIAKIYTPILNELHSSM